MGKEYINPNNPVYFSYAWANDEHPDIEDDVNNLCNVLEENDIYYKRDKINLCNYRWCINDSEIEIGEGAAIIVVISERYLKSLHCMNEWHLMREDGKILERVFPIVLEDANITDKNTFKNKYYQYFKEREQSLIEQQNEGIIPLTRVETEAARVGFYIDDLRYMYQYLADNNRSNLHELRKDKYEIVISQLKDFLKQIVDSTYNNNTKSETTSSIPSFPVSIPKGLLHRDAEVEELYDGIIDNHFLNLVGVGGSGKTSLTYLMMQKHRYDFNEIAYVVANNDIEDDFIDQINATLKLSYEAGEDYMYKKIIAFLEENYTSDKPNLLVLDINETTKEAANKKFINELYDTIDNWYVLILSREHFTTFNFINLNDNQDSEFIKKLFLLKAGDKYNDFEDFDGLFKFIDYTPILAEQLGLYLNGLPKKSLAEIKKVFHGEYFREEDISEGVSAINRHNKIVSFLEKLIDYNSFKPNAQKLLCHFILWQAEYIDYNIIKNLLKDVFASDDDYENAIVALYKRAILTQKNLPNGSTSYKLHGLLAESLRGKIDISKQDYSVYLNNIKEIIEYGYYEFIPYIDCIGNSLCEHEIVPDYNYNLLNKVGIKSVDTWKTDYAKRLFEKYISILSNKVANNPNDSDYQKDLATGYLNLANLQSDHLNDYKSAETNYKESIEIWEKLPKENSYNQYGLALTYNNLAVLQEDYLYNYKSAETNFNKAIKIGKRLPKDNPEYQDRLSGIYCNLAVLQADHLNDHASAETNYKNAIEIGKRLPKDNSVYQYGLAATYGNLAILQKNYLTDYKSAETNYKNAIEIQERLPKNPIYQDSLALAYGNLALLQQNNLNDNTIAEVYFKKAIETAEPLVEVNRKLFLINWIEYKYRLAKLHFDTDKVEYAKSILEEIKPLAEEYLAKNPNDKETKDVNDWINDLWEKINKRESAT